MPDMQDEDARGAGGGCAVVFEGLGVHGFFTGAAFIDIADSLPGPPQIVAGEFLHRKLGGYAEGVAQGTIEGDAAVFSPALGAACGAVAVGEKGEDLKKHDVSRICRTHGNTR